MTISRVLVASILFLCTISPAAAEVVKVAGSGGMIPLVTELAREYMARHRGETVEVNQNSLGKEGGTMALNKGAIDIAMLSTVNEKDRSLPFEFHPLAIVPSVFGVHPSVTVRKLTGQQVCDIYAGKIRNWKELGGPDAPIVVLTRPENESAKIAIRNGLACFRNLQETPTAISLAKAKDMSTTLEKTPYAIGMLNTVMLEESKGKIVAPDFDGMSVAALQPARWPMKTTSYLATRKNPPPAVSRFIGFAKSAEAKKIIRREKGIPAE